ncbi:winged helix-turn-helix domain-containing protein [bacterium]|nr:winged helix-turn-helix domain-containing protein [bacterium]
MRSKGSAAELERRRLLAIERLHDGHSTREVAEFLGVHLRTVQKWKALHNQKGDAGLASKPPLGRMPKLTNRQIQTVLGWFRRSPMEFGYSTELWTSRRLGDLIKKTFGVTFSSNYLCRWLTARDITPQKPKRQACQRDEVRIKDWVRNDWPRLVKKGQSKTPISCWSMRPAACSPPSSAGP